MKNDQELIVMYSEYTRATFIQDTSGQCNVYTYCSVFPRTIDSRHKETASDGNTPFIQPVSPSTGERIRNVQRYYRVLSVSRYRRPKESRNDLYSQASL